MRSLRSRDATYKKELTEAKDALKKSEREIRELEDNLAEARKREEGWSEERRRLSEQIPTEGLTTTQSDENTVPQKIVADDELAQWKKKAEVAEDQCRELQDQLEAKQQGRQNLGELLRIAQSELEQSKAETLRLGGVAKENADLRMQAQKLAAELSAAHREAEKLSGAIRPRPCCEASGEVVRVSIPAARTAETQLGLMAAKLKGAEDDLKRLRVDAVRAREASKRLKQEILVYSKENTELKVSVGGLVRAQKLTEGKTNELQARLTEAEQMSDKIEANATTMKRESAAQVQRLEDDLVRTKQDLAEALNAMREFEEEHMEFCGDFEKRMTFKEVSPERLSCEAS